METKGLLFPKAPKKKHKRITVSNETYQIVYDACNGKCVLCNSNKYIHLHHIIYRSENRSLIDEPTNCVLLCRDCHDYAHTYKKKYQPMLKALTKIIYKGDKTNE